MTKIIIDQRILKQHDKHGVIIPVDLGERQIIPSFPDTGSYNRTNVPCTDHRHKTGYRGYCYLPTCNNYNDSNFERKPDQGLQASPDDLDSPGISANSNDKRLP